MYGQKATWKFQVAFSVSVIITSLVRYKSWEKYFAFSLSLPPPPPMPRAPNSINVPITIIDFARISLFTDYCSDNEFNSNIPQPNLNRHLQEALRCSTLIQEHYPDKAQEIETMANLVTWRHVSAINRFQNDPQRMQVYCKLQNHLVLELLHKYWLTGPIQTKPAYGVAKPNKNIQLPKMLGHNPTYILVQKRLPETSGSLLQTNTSIRSARRPGYRSCDGWFLALLYSRLRG